MTTPTLEQFVSLWAKACGRKLDGLALPFEALSFAPSNLGKRKAMAYPYPGGKVFLPEDAHVLYGYPDQKSFRRALSRRDVQVKTTAGVLSLGDALSRKNRPHLVSVFPQDTLWKLSWPCTTREEAEEVAGFIRGIVPGVQPVISKGALGGLLAGIPESIRKSPVSLMRAIPRKAHGDLLFLALCGLTVIALAVNALTGGSPWLVPVACISFAILTRNVIHRLTSR